MSDTSVKILSRATVTESVKRLSITPLNSVNHSTTESVKAKYGSHASRELGAGGKVVN